MGSNSFVYEGHGSTPQKRAYWHTTWTRLGPDPERRVKILTSPHWMTIGEHGGTLSVMWNSMTWQFLLKTQ